MRGDVAGDYGAGGDEGVVPDSDSANDRRIRTNSCATLDYRPLRCGTTRDGRARVANVGKHCRGADEHIVCQDNAVVERNVVLNPTTISNFDVSRHEDVLTEHTVGSNACSRHDVAEVPYLGGRSDPRARIDHAGGVPPVTFHPTSTGNPPLRIDKAPASRTRTTARACAPFPTLVSLRATLSTKWRH